MFGFLEGVAFVGFGDFGVAFAFGDAAHGEVHAYFAAFAVEVCLEVFDDVGIDALGYADDVFGGEDGVGGWSVEFGGWGFALGAVRRRLIASVDVTANGTDPFFHDVLLHYGVEIFSLGTVYLKIFDFRFLIFDFFLRESHLGFSENHDGTTWEIVSK